MKIRSWSRAVSFCTSAVLLSLIVAACSGPETVAPGSLSAGPSGLAHTGEDVPTGYVRVCKVGGPAGTYTFNVAVSGGGMYTLNWGAETTLDFDGVTSVCKQVYSTTGLWDAGQVADVTVSEVLAPGMSVAQIDVFDVNLPFPGFLATLTNQSSVTVKVTPANRYKLNYFNAERPAPSANCYAISAVAGVAITPVQLAATGGAGAPYTFGATGLPAGLTLSSTGVLSGTPTVTGTFSYSVTVTDKDGTVGTGGTCSVTVTPPPPQFADETAVGAGLRYPDNKNWFMYTPYTTAKVDLIAGQHYDAGDIYMSRSGGNTIIRIVFQNGFSWANVIGNLKINPFNSAPTAWLQPGAFQYHFNVTGNTVTVTIPGTTAKFYGIHGDVLRVLP